ncbi:colanic acid biosynthesis glycosyltransferase WcaC [soil metagenome]
MTAADIVPADRPLVLQVNATLSEGGAAGVARTIHDELPTFGFRTAFAYGYGPSARSSPLEGAYNATRVTPLPLVAINRVSYAMTGRDRSLRVSTSWKDLKRLVARADLVHLHVIHSYFVDTGALVNLLIDEQKPVVWTMHDQWLMTGRCAQPGPCRRWTEGCSPCPHKAAYPPARIDHSGSVFRERRGLLGRLSSSVPVQLVACAEWLSRELRQADVGTVNVIQNSVDPAFWRAAEAPADRSRHAKTRVLFMCRDLRDRHKIDWELLRLVAAHPDCELTIVGDLPPVVVASAVHMPALTSREEIAHVMRAHDVLLFTSEVDYYPLTVAEALAAGLQVVAVDSQAAREFVRFPALHLYGSHAQAFQILGVLEQSFGLATETKDFFRPARMVRQYSELYSELMGDGR